MISLCFPNLFRRIKTWPSNNSDAATVATVLVGEDHDLSGGHARVAIRRHDTLSRIDVPCRDAIENGQCSTGPDESAPDIN